MRRETPTEPKIELQYDSVQDVVQVICGLEEICRLCERMRGESAEEQFQACPGCTEESPIMFRQPPLAEIIDASHERVGGEIVKVGAHGNLELVFCRSV